MLEEARELVEAKTHDHITAEAADVIYFALVYCARAGVSIADIEKELDRFVVCLFLCFGQQNGRGMFGHRWKFLILFLLDVHSKLLAGQETQSLPSKCRPSDMSVVVSGARDWSRWVWLPCGVKAFAHAWVTLRCRCNKVLCVTFDSIDLKTNRPRIRRLKKGLQLYIA